MTLDATEIGKITRRDSEADVLRAAILIKVEIMDDSGIEAKM